MGEFVEQAFTSLSGRRSALISSFGRKNVSFHLQPRQIRLQISCAVSSYCSLSFFIYRD